MKGEERYLLNLLEGSRTRFVIPVYQRNYDWKIEQCSQLFGDLEDMAFGGGRTSLAALSRRLTAMYEW